MNNKKSKVYLAGDKLDGFVKAMQDADERTAEYIKDRYTEVLPNPSEGGGSVRVDTPEGTSKYCKKRFSEFS